MAFVLKFIENLFIRFPELLFHNKRKWAHETKDNNLTNKNQTQKKNENKFNEP